LLLYDQPRAQGCMEAWLSAQPSRWIEPSDGCPDSSRRFRSSPHPGAFTERGARPGAPAIRAEVAGPALVVRVAPVTIRRGRTRRRGVAVRIGAIRVRRVLGIAGTPTSKPKATRPPNPVTVVVIAEDALMPAGDVTKCPAADCHHRPGATSSPPTLPTCPRYVSTTSGTPGVPATGATPPAFPRQSSRRRVHAERALCPGRARR